MNEDLDLPSDEVSLEELAAAYARALGVPDKPAAPPPEEEHDADGNEKPLLRVSSAETERFELSPKAVVEACLFVGHPQNEPLSAQQLAGLMRDVQADEIDEIIQELNRDYEAEGAAMRIETAAGGYRMVLASSVETVRTVFYGRAREARLTQSAIDVLALIAYQPGVTAAELDEQRGRGSAGVAAQLVRRRLVELRRETDSAGSRISRYFPTDRFLKLFGLNQLSDLPQVDESLLPPE